MYRKYNSKFESQVLTLFAGEYYVSSRHEILSTVLGSCIAVCLYDSKKRIGGMNHFMLPMETSGSIRFCSRDAKIENEEFFENSTRYGMTAMEVLISEMQKKGANRKHLTAKIFGGGNVLSSRNHNSISIGDKNIGFIRAYLKMEGISIEKENVGERHGRKIFFLTEKNVVFVKKVAIEPAALEERKYIKKLQAIKNEGDITLF